ncbi:MAG: hypothetical protein IPM29_14185 [Planctomycetes bacterium]|nr:hypothetical protein [Planctomycetota bacterium]
MDTWLDTIRAFAEQHRQLLVALGLASLATAIAGVLWVPRWLAGLPADHFVRPRPALRSRPHPVLSALAVAARNTVGLALLLAGIAMLVLPGQGLLTILLALGLLDFPGKRRLRVRFVMVSPIRRALDALRRRAGRAPFRLPPPRR